ASIRTIALRNVRITSRGRDITIGAQSSLAGSRLTVTSFTAAANATSIQASGVITLEPAIDAQIKASARRLDVDDLLALANAFAPEAAPKPRRAAGAQERLVAVITADQVSAA